MDYTDEDKLHFSGLNPYKTWNAEVQDKSYAHSAVLQGKNAALTGSTSLKLNGTLI